MRKFWFTIAFLLITITSAYAQSCTTDVLQALSRAGAACSDVLRNQVCYGNGLVEATFPMGEATLPLVGDRAEIDFMTRLQVGGDAATEFSVATIKLQANLLDTQPGRNLTVLASGNAVLENQVALRPISRITSTGTLNIRTLPDGIDGDIIKQVPLRTSLTANGITENGAWLRVEVPDESTVGWVLREIIVAAETDLSILNIVDVDTPYLRPYQVMTVQTGSDDTPCTGAPQSGILLQSPSVEDTVTITINNAVVKMAGTVFLQAPDGDPMLLNQIDGFSEITYAGTIGYMVGGARIAIDTGLGDAEPYDSTDLIGLPTNNLTYRVRVPAPVDDTVLASAIDRYFNPPVTPTRIPASDRPPPCITVTTTRATLYAGPGTYYEVIRELTANTRIVPVQEQRDSDGNVWWQLNNGHYIQASRAERTGDCDSVPLTEIVGAPQANELSLERCESFNGPIRAGQTVTIEFNVKVGETYDEARNSIYYDPGTITVNQDRLRVYHSNPREVSEDVWYRSFYASWTAEAGTFRIEGDRLSYEVICDITVPVG